MISLHDLGEMADEMQLPRTHPPRRSARQFLPLINGTGQQIR